MSHVCSVTQTFLSDLFDLNKYNSILNLSWKELIDPYKDLIMEGIIRSPQVVRLIAPFFGISLGLSVVVVAVINLVEGIFKGIVNISIGVLTLDMSKIKSAITYFVESLYIVSVSAYHGVKIGTIGSVGLIIAQDWTYHKIIDF